MNNISKTQGYKFLRNALIAVSISIATILLITVFAKGIYITEKIQKFSILESVSYFAIFFLVFIIDSFRTVLLSHFLGERFPFLRAVENSILGYFFSYITPFSAGGQPFQIYHLSHSGLKSENASAIILTRWSNMLILLSFSSALLSLKYLKFIRTGINFIDKIVWVIILLSIIVSAVVVFSLLFPFVGFFVLRILKSIKFPRLFGVSSNKILKRKVEEFENWLGKFYNSIHTLWIKRPWIVALDLLLGALDLAIIFYTLYRAILFSSYLSNTQFKLSFLSFSAIYILLSYIVYYVPTPGASGGVEGGFFSVLSQYGDKASVMRGIILWRISTYYFTILLGLIILFFLYKRGDII